MFGFLTLTTCFFYAVARWPSVLRNTCNTFFYMIAGMSSATRAIASLNSEQTVVHLASRIAERQLRETILQHIPRREDLIAGTTSSVSVNVPSTYQAELTRLQSLRDNSDIAGIVSRYPVRESGFLSAIAAGLRFSNRTDYERAVLSRLSVDNELCDSLRSKLGALAQRLG